MIKFFRKIRQNLLSEGKTGKYIKYAIGEIILVVIGILIALQINNWNENHKNKSILSNYTESLIQDLKQDTTTLNIVTKHIVNDNTHLANLTERLSSKNATIDSLKKIVRYDLSADFKTYRPPNDKTLLAMQANGIMELFDEQTYSLIMDLQTAQGVAKSIITTNNAAFVTQFSNLISKYTINETNTIKGPLLDKYWENIDENDLFATVEGVMSMKKEMNRNNGTSYNMLLTLTETLLDRLIKIHKK
ncbi:DUF6090 family protein [Winogradskyella flava]|uniref:Uncharacterized protein n=1 Tax=Winogradskyella flava TaxID=1884876 RepID=A0A842IYE7_9FLAO|nr:DUF6090 family protein [Winogradskyella flava]MBC2846693.1 hypothetical protein [Winogradskyella flava]